MKKDPNAVKLGSKGGKARARNLSSARKLAISQKANEAKRQKKLSTPLPVQP